MVDFSLAKSGPRRMPAALSCFGVVAASKYLGNFESTYCQQPISPLLECIVVVLYLVLLSRVDYLIALCFTSVLLSLSSFLSVLPLLVTITELFIG